MKNNSPKIRFFSEDVKRKINTLEEVATFNPKSSVPRKFKYVDLESVIGTELIAYRDEIAETAPSRAQRLAKNGDIFYQTVRPYQKNNLFFDLKDEDYVFSSGYAQLRPLIDGYYLFSQLQDTRFVETVLEMCTGTSYPAINSKTLSKIEINIPNNEEELKKIGVFFKQLDEIISLQQQELEALKQTKQGFLQKMFPEEEESIPKVRLSKYSGQWTTEELGSLVNKIRSYSLSRDVETNSLSEYKYIHYGDIHKRVAKYIDDLSCLPNIRGGNYEWLEEGDLVLADASEDYQGIANAAILAIKPMQKVIAGLHTIALRPNPQKLNSLYLYYLLESSLFKKFGYKTGTGMKVFGISTTNLLKFNAIFPTIEEQSDIGDFFRQLDVVIELKERELEALRQTKKGFLQKMFV